MSPVCFVKHLPGLLNPVPQLRLTIYDRKTHYILWTISRSIAVATLQRAHDRNFDQALTDIIIGFKHLLARYLRPRIDEFFLQPISLNLLAFKKSAAHSDPPDGGFLFAGDTYASERCGP